MHRPAIELSAAVVKVDIGLKVSLTQNQSLQCVTPALMHAKIPQLRDAMHWIEQWRHDQVGRRPLPNRTEFINFFERDLISNDSCFCLLILSAVDVQCHVFTFEKLLLNVRITLLHLYNDLSSFTACVYVCYMFIKRDLIWFDICHKRYFCWRQIWRHLHLTVLQCWAKFSDGLVHQNIRMIPAKNYETVCV